MYRILHLHLSSGSAWKVSHPPSAHAKIRLALAGYLAVRYQPSCLRLPAATGYQATLFSSLPPSPPSPAAGPKLQPLDSLTTLVQIRPFWSGPFSNNGRRSLALHRVVCTTSPLALVRLFLHHHHRRHKKASSFILSAVICVGSGWLLLFFGRAAIV